MAYKQSPGRMNMPKTGRGVDVPTLMTGSPARKDDPDPVDGSFGSAFKGAKGKDFTYQGKKYSGMTKEKAEFELSQANSNISNFEGKSPKHNASHYQTGKDTGNYEYAKYMGHNNSQIGKNVEAILTTQKKAAHALGRGDEATKFKNPFKNSARHTGNIVSGG